MNRNNRTSDRLHRILAGLLAMVMVLGLVVGSGSAVPVRAAEAEAVEAPAEEKAPEKASAEKEAKKAEEKKAVESTCEDAETEESAADLLTASPAQEKDSEEETSEEVTAEEPAGQDEDTVTLAEMQEETAPEAENANLEVNGPEEDGLTEETAEKASAAVILGRNVTNVAHFLPPVIGTAKRRMLKAVPKKASKDDNGVRLAKDAVYDEETGNLTISLESYVTGESIITEVTESVPTDIVMVLDLSFSMNWYFGYYFQSASRNPYTWYDERDNVWHKVGDKYYPVTVSRVLSNQKYYYTFSYVDDNGNTIVLYDKITSNEKKTLYIKKEGPKKRIEALREAYSSFVGKVKESAQGESGADDDINHRIAVVGFSDSATDLSGGFKNMNLDADAASIAGIRLTPDGSTHIEKGIAKAIELFNNNPVQEGEKRNRVVIVFTDGIPGEVNAWGRSSSICADQALEYASDLKADKVTIYSVGIFDGADATSAGTPYTSTTQVSSAAASAPYANYFMQHLSSNNGEVKDPSFYLSAQDADSLTSIFKQIASEVETGGASTTTLTEDTVIRDIVSPMFKVPENATDVTFQSAAYTGENQWADPVDEPGVTATIKGDTLDVTGFNFSENWCGTVTEADGSETYRGKKLIIKFMVPIDPAFLGGSDIETNGENSGLYEKADSENPLASFDVPKVKVPLKTIDVAGNDWNIYTSTEDELGDVFRKLKFTIDDKEIEYSKIFNGVNNSGVDVSFNVKDTSGATVYTYTIPAGQKAGSWNGGDLPNLQDEKYTVECVVKDHENSNSKTASGSINIFVYKPVVTYDDKNVYYKGNQLSSDTFAPLATEWKCGDKLDTSVTMDTTKPELTFTYVGPTDTTVDQMDDYTVKVTKVGVKNTEKDLTDQTTFSRDCKSEDGSWPQETTADKAFKIHVYTPSVAFEDMEKYYGESISFTAPTPTWDNTGVTMDNTAPALTVDVMPADGAVNDKGYVAVKDDFNVKAVVKAGETDITQALIDKGKITRSCKKNASHTAVSTDCAFVVHVKTAKLDVTKQIEGAFADKTAKYSFTVTVTPDQASGLQAVTETKELGNGDKLEMEGLPKGASVTVTEAAVPTNYTVTATLNDATARVSGETDKTVTGTLTADENHIVVTNKLESVPITGVDVPVIYLELLMAGSAALGIALVAYAARRKREVRSR